YDHYVLALDVAGLFQALSKPTQPRCDHFGRSGIEKPDDRRCMLLSACQARPNKNTRTGNSFDEVSSPHFATRSSGQASYQPPAAVGSCRASGRLCPLMTKSRHSRRKMSCLLTPESGHVRPIAKKLPIFSRHSREQVASS